MRILTFPPKTVLGFKKNGQPIYNIAGGSEPVGDDTGYTGGDVTGAGDGINPAWGEYLNSVPEEHRQYVIPAFKAWDGGVQERFNKVHQTYEPWKPMVEAGVDPETAQFAVNFLSQLDSDPETVYKKIGEFYKLNGGSDSGQGLEGPNTEETNPLDPRLTQVERQNQVIAQHLLEQVKQREVEAAEAQLDQELTSARKKFGDFDEKFVLAYAQNGMEIEDAVKEYVKFRDGERARFGVKPLIMGPGGGVPQYNNTDVRKLSDSQTKDMVVQMLSARAAEGNQ